MHNHPALSLPASVLFALVGGVSMWLAHEPVGIWPLAFVGLATLWILMRGRTWYGAFGWAFVWAFTFFYFLFDWARGAAGTWLAQLGLAGVEAIYIGALGSVWAGLRRWPERWNFPGRPAIVVISAVLSWLAMEQLRGAWPLGGMPWGTLAFGFVDSPLVRLAPIGSTQLVGAVAVLASILLALAIESIVRGRYLASISALVAGALLVATPSALPVGARPESRVTAGIVQGTVPDVDRLGPGQSRALEVTKNHMAAARTILGDNLELFIFPESTSDRDFRQDAQSGELISNLADEAGVPMLLGTQEYRDDVRENHYVAYMPGTGVVDVYAKQHPVPFGEYVPARDFFRSITTAVDQVSTDMVAGEKLAILEVELDDATLAVATPICFEVAYSEIIAEAMRDGAQLLIVPTNNQSFAGSGEPEQQFAMSRFRAVENAKTTVQVATSGITGVIEPNGVVHYQTEFGATDARVVNLALNSQVTLAAKTEVTRRVITYALGALAGIVGLISLIMSWREGRELTSRKKKS